MLLPYKVFPVRRSVDLPHIVGWLIARGTEEPMINRDGTPWDTVYYRRNTTDAAVLCLKLNDKGVHDAE